MGKSSFLTGKDKADSALERMPDFALCQYTFAVYL